MNKITIVFAGALALATTLSPIAAFARHGGGHFGGGHFGHAGGGHFGGGHFGRPHFGHPNFGHRNFGRPHFGRPGFYGRPHFGGPGFYGRPYRGGFGRGYGVGVFGGGYRPYPVYARPRVAHGYGYAPGCTTRRSVGFLPGGYRKVVTVRTCIVP